MGDDYERFCGQIGEILSREWNPKSRHRPGKYETYANKLASLMLKGAHDEHLLHFLEWAERVELDIAPPFNVARGCKVVVALRTIEMPEQA